MNRPPPPQDWVALDLKKNFNLFVGLSQGFAFPVEIFTRRFGTWGKRYARGHAMVGLAAFWVVVVLLGSGNPDFDARPLCWFMVLSGGMLVLHRLQRAVYESRGIYPPSSVYSGVSRLWRLSKNEYTAKGVSEPGLALLAGVLLLPVSQELAWGLWISSFALAVSIEYERQRTTAIVNDMRDAAAEQRYRAQLLREVMRDED